MKNERLQAKDASAIVRHQPLVPARLEGRVDRDPLEQYMHDVHHYPVLSADDQHDLAVRFLEEGDTAAARALVTTNLRLVVKIARELHRGQGALLDLIQEGNLGLMHAVRKYDPYRGVKLSSYAAWWIRAYILRSIMKNARLVRIGTSQNHRKLFFRLRREISRRDSLGLATAPEDIARQLEVPVADVIEMMARLSAREISLDATVSGAESGAVSIVDTIASDSAPVDDSIDENAQRGAMVAKIDQFGEKLAGRERVIFEERLVSEEPRTLQDLGEKFGISRERVRQIEKNLQKKLEKYLRAELPAEMLAAA